jgi:hypothetical protein
LHHHSSRIVTPFGASGGCGGQESVDVLDIIAAVLCKLTGSTAWQVLRRRSMDVKTPAEIASQVLELASLFHDTIFVIKPISLTGAALSKRIYKICTLLSTGFVDNVAACGATPPRKAWPDAGFRGATREPCEPGR